MRFDRALSPPGSHCATRGTAIYLDEKADINGDAEDAGGGIDPAKMPLDPANDCKPVFPHQLMRVNNIFEVVHNAGGRTAWADQHPAYADLFAGTQWPWPRRCLCTPKHMSPALKQNVARSFQHDRSEGRSDDSLDPWTGPRRCGTCRGPAPLRHDVHRGQRYTKGKGDRVPRRSGHSESRSRAGPPPIPTEHWAGLWRSSRRNNSSIPPWIIVTAKHGQSPIDVKKRRIIADTSVEAVVDLVQKGLAAHITTDTVGLIWLNDQSMTTAVVNAYRARMDTLGIQEILSGEKLRLFMNSPAADSRIARYHPATRAWRYLGRQERRYPQRALAASRMKTPTSPCWCRGINLPGASIRHGFRQHRLRP